MNDNSETIQAKAMIVVFGLLGVFALIGAFINPYHIATTVLYGIMVLTGVYEYKKIKRK